MSRPQGDAADQGRIDRATHRARSRRIGVNAIVNAAGGISYSAAVVLITPMAIAALGEEAWGIWQLAGATAGFAILLNLGLNSAASYHVSRSLAVGDMQSLGKSINSMRAYLIAASAALLLALFAFGRPLVESLFDASNVEIGYQALVISVALTAVTIPVRAFPSVLSGLQRYDLYAYFRMGSGIALLVGVALALDRGMGLLGFIVAMSLAPVLPAVLAWVAARVILPRQCFAWRSPDVPHLVEMIHYSSSTLIYTAGIAVLYQVMKFTASWNCGGPVAAGYIGLAVNVAQMLSVLFVPMTGVLHTRVSDLHAQGRDDQIVPLLLRALSAMGMLAVPSLVFLALEARSVFEVWIGSSVSPEVVTELGTTLRYMLVGQGLYVLFLPCFYALVGLGQHRVFGIGMLAAGLLNGFAGFIATRHAPEISVLGLVFGLSLSVVILGATVPTTLRRFSIRPMRVIVDPLLLPMLASLPGALAVLYRPDWLDGLFDLVFAGVLFGVLTLPGLALLQRRLSRIA